MMGIPKVSIVFTSYNHKKYLNQALDSILAQTFTDYELIIIDDCSTDGSQIILKEYAEKDDRIKLTLNETNSGSYVYSTNQGASLASAPYLIFAQCDDWAEPTQVECLTNAMQKNNVGVVFSSSNMVDGDGKVIGCDFNGRSAKFRAQHNNDSVIKGTEATSYLMESCIIPNLSAALIKKDVYDKLGGLSDKYKVLADWDFWLRATAECDYYYIRKPLNNFRQHGSTIRSTIKMKRQINEVFEMVFSFGGKTGLSDLTCSRIASRLWIYWAVNGKKEWIEAFPNLIYEGIKRSVWMIYTLPEQLISIVTRKVLHTTEK